MSVLLKQAESSDSPNEYMVSMMIRAETIREKLLGNTDFKFVYCPMCQTECCFNIGLMVGAMEIYPSRLIPLCSECGIKAHLDKTIVPKWLETQGKTANQILGRILGEKPHE